MKSEQMRLICQEKKKLFSFYDGVRHNGAPLKRLMKVKGTESSLTQNIVSLQDVLDHVGERVPDVVRKLVLL